MKDALVVVSGGVAEEVVPPHHDREWCAIWDWDNLKEGADHCDIEDAIALYETLPLWMRMALNQDHAIDTLRDQINPEAGSGDD